MKMKFQKNLIGNEDERAVSPVIGVILMVAITVILAAVIAAFVLDIGDIGESAPTADFDWEQDGETEVHNVTVQHSGGDPLDQDELRVSVIDNSGDSTTVDVEEWAVDGISAGSTLTLEDVDDSPVDADGDGMTMQAATNSDLSFDNTHNVNNLDSGYEIRIIWAPDNGGSQILTEYEVR